MKKSGGWHSRGGLSLALSRACRLDWTTGETHPCSAPGSPFPWHPGLDERSQEEWMAVLVSHQPLAITNVFFWLTTAPATCEGPRPRGRKAFGDFLLFHTSWAPVNTT